MGTGTGKMVVKRVFAGRYEIQVGPVKFLATTLEILHDDGTHKAGAGWRLIVEVEPGTWDFEWCNDFATLWECKEAAALTAADEEAGQ